MTAEVLGRLGSRGAFVTGGVGAVVGRSTTYLWERETMVRLEEWGTIEGNQGMGMKEKGFQEIYLNILSYFVQFVGAGCSTSRIANALDPLKVSRSSC